MRPVLELKGIESQFAYYAYHKLMLGLNMLPSYVAEKYQSFYNRIDKLSDDDKLAILKEAAIFVDLNPKELQDLAYFCTDKNGIRYTPINMKNLNPIDITEIIVSVCWACSKLGFDFLSDDEKKNSVNSQST